MKQTTLFPVLPEPCSHFSVRASQISCFLILFTIFFFPATMDAQSVALSGILNRYSAVTSIDTCNGRISVGDTTGFRKGATLLLIQMQGATISNSNNANFGQVQTYNAVGRYERVVIDSVAFNAIYAKNRFLYKYTPAAKVQVVTFPRYTHAYVTDTLRAKPWDGSTGGVLALEISDTLRLDAPISADGCGFRGGAAYANPVNNCNWAIPELAYSYADGNWRGSFKGEGISIPDAGKELGRGPQANGGGGGNDHNTGGGGGGNLFSGGKGGNNDEPSAFGCDGYAPGLGGYGILSFINRIYLGGGGGAGHANNLLNSAGGAGGGIILLKARTITGTQQIIASNGGSAKTAVGDGGGGGGAGGSIWLELTNPANGLSVLANGGKGGSINANNQNRCFGPGGGGSGGHIISNQNGIPVPLGGAPGMVTNSSNGCNGSTNNASAGQNGEIPEFTPIPQETMLVFAPAILNNPQSENVCAGESAVFSVISNIGNWQYQWQVNNGSGWQNIGNAQGYAGFNSPTLTLTATTNNQNGYQYRCSVSRVGCTSIISEPASLQIQAKPTAAFDFNQSGTTVVLTNMASNYTSVFWTFGDGSFSQNENPTHTYNTSGNYVITQFAFNACDTSIQMVPIQIILAPKAGFLSPDSTAACDVAEIIFANAAINASSYQWAFPGGNPASSNLSDPIVNYYTTGNYTARQIVSNVAGSDTLERNFFIQIDKVPLASFIVSSIFNGLVNVNNMSTPGATCTWNFGDGSSEVVGENPSYQYTQSGVYNITLAVTNPCGASILQSQIQVAIVAVSSPLAPIMPVIYPNPATKQFFVDCSKMEARALRARLYDTNGRVVTEQIIDSEPVFTMYTADLPASMYQLQLVFPGRILVIPVCIH